jgi:glyoxylate reductase
MVSEAGLSLLRAEAEVDYRGEDRVIPHEELLARVGPAVGIVSGVFDPVDSAVMDAAPGLKVIANCAVGYDNIDVAAATHRGIVVTNTPGVLTETTADLAFALMMASARRVAEGDRYVRAGRWDRFQMMLMLGADVYGKTLGIAGCGRIGQAVARRGRGFGMEVLYTKREVLEPALERDLGAHRVDKETLLRESDFVVLTIPLTEETRNYIGAGELRAMKPTAFLINIARGAVVDEPALVEALQEGEIAGAGLDVYVDEPNVPPKLVEMENVVVLPHIGSASVETRDKMALLAAENCLAVLGGRQPPTPVNPEVLEG